ncbi:MAG TPA: 23S rRNA (adenine(2503)-C(2))-methyltransferase RlmN [Bacteroidetes bacterium]|nr:23S rRNA (adenine(2503)-C(2))-methyltransferase RlmN [Bacteroidota bacterium]
MEEKPLLHYDREGLETLLRERFGVPAFHGRQLHAWLYRRGVFDPARLTDLSKALRAALAALTRTVLPRTLEAVTGEAESTATKFLFELEDGERVEAVYIPAGDRNTVCLSSQVGCAYGCRFCATGQLGLKRNMTAGEMAGCFLAVRAAVPERITNVVFMGMGEPLANPVEVMEAWRRLTDPDGIGLSQRRVTLSTIGLPKAIRRLAGEPCPPKLVFSIGSPREELRRKLLPVAGRFSLEENHAALREYARNSKHRITIALLVAEGLNDSPEDARALHRWIGELPAKVNLLRYNEAAGGFRRADEGKVEAVAQTLVSLGRTVILRASRGRDVSAACGQLAARALTSPERR